jgi:hypothetical protein
MLIGPRASRALMIMSGLEARGPTSRPSLYVPNVTYPSGLIGQAGL